MTRFYTPPHKSGRVSWFHVGCPCVCPSVVNLSICSFPDNNFSKYQWIFTKLGMCSDGDEIGLGLLMAKFLQFLTELSALHMIVVGYYDSLLLYPPHNSGRLLWFHVGPLCVHPFFHSFVFSFPGPSCSKANDIVS